MAEIQLKTYQFRGSSNKKSDGKWYPRVEHYSTIKADALSRLAAEDSRIERSEVQYVTAAIVKQIIELVMNGHSIKVPELGTFSISAKSITVDDWNDISCDESDVPRLHPNTGASACPSVITPALMNPASIVVAAAECARNPTTTPNTTPCTGLFVVPDRILRSDAPAAAVKLRFPTRCFRCSAAVSGSASSER